MKVRVNHTYYYVPNLLDRIDGRTSLELGDLVRVVNLPGCPPANTMQHCHVADPDCGRFIGLVHTNSLYNFEEYRVYLQIKIAQAEHNEL